MVQQQAMTLREFYVALIDDLLREIPKTKSSPQGNWSYESGPPLINFLEGLRNRVVQAGGSTDLSSTDNTFLRLISFMNVLSMETREEIESLKETLRQRGLI
jgi:hypothetical protein